MKPTFNSLKSNHLKYSTNVMKQNTEFQSAQYTGTEKAKTMPTAESLTIHI